jgi:hypothetical protein
MARPDRIPLEPEIVPIFLEIDWGPRPVRG